MDYAYKGFTGSYSPIKEGDEKHSATHVIMTIKEYNELVEKNRELNRKLSAEESNHRSDVANVKYEASEYKKKADEAAQAKMDEAERKVASIKNELNRQIRLNQNLLRISKERANAKRGLQPKKTHSGYRFVGKICQTQVVKTREKGKAPTYAWVWTATIETPYAVTIPVDTIADKIAVELREVLDKSGIVIYTVNGNPSIIWRCSYTEAVKTINEDQIHDVAFDHKYMANAKTGLWEIQITTVKQITVTTEMMA